MNIKDLFSSKNNPVSVNSDFLKTDYSTLTDDGDTLPLTAQINITEMRSKQMLEYNKGFIRAYREKVLGVLPLENDINFRNSVLTKGKDTVDIIDHYKQGYNGLLSFFDKKSFRQDIKPSDGQDTDSSSTSDYTE